MVLFGCAPRVYSCQARVFHKKRRRWDVLAVGGRYDSTVAQ